MIDISQLSIEELVLVKDHLLENKILTIGDFIAPIEEYFYKLDLNPETQSYELYMGVPNDWLHDMIMDSYEIALISESETGKLVKLFINDENKVATIDDLVDFAVMIVTRNNEILSKIREKEKELLEMKNKMIEKQIELTVEIENLKKVKAKEKEEEEETKEEEVVKEEVSGDVEVKTIKPKTQIYKPPVAKTAK